MTFKRKNNLFTNGDNDREMNEDVGKLVEALKGMNVNVLGRYNFRRFSGTRGAEAESFLRQFIAYERNWTEQQALAQVENCLQGKALKWFQGARDSLFNNWCEFKAEFLEGSGTKRHQKFASYWIC